MGFVKACCVTICVWGLVSQAAALQGHLFYAADGGLYRSNLETGATTLVTSRLGLYADIALSPDGRQVAQCGTWQASGGILIVNTGGTHDSVLTYGSDYSGPAPNKYDINRNGATYNYGLGRTCAFGPKGVYFVRCVGEWPNQSEKVLCYADRATGIVHELVDFSPVNDGHQALFVSEDGRKVLSWSHSYTVAIDVNATHTGGTYHLIDGIWGHGPVIPSDGSVVISSAIEGECDVVWDHRTWVVYDWASGACGNYLDRWESVDPSMTGIGAQAIVHGSTASGESGADYITFRAENGNAYIMNWKTHATERIPAFGPVFLGALPTGDEPTISAAPGSLAFTGSGSASVTVSNTGGGTLATVSTSISYGSGSAWLSAEAQGNGNTQTIVNTCDASALSTGSYSATVTVSGGGASNTATYAVSLDLNVPGDIATSVSGTRFRHVTITWSDNSDGETGYAIERSLNGDAWCEIGTAAAGATSYTDSSVTCGTGTYAYRLRAVFAGPSYSDYSGESSVVVSCVDWVDVTGPAGGEEFQSGDTIWIQWTAHNVEQVYIEGTYNDGEDWVQISVHGGVSPTMPGWGNWPWAPSLPDGIDSTATGLVRISRYTDRNGVSDISGAFTIHGDVAVNGMRPARQSVTPSGLEQRALTALNASTQLTYTLDAGQTGVIRVFLPNGALVHSFTCTEEGTHVVPRGPSWMGSGLRLVDMIIRP